MTRGGSLRALEGLAQEIFEGYPAATLVVDRDFRLSMVNRAARAMLGAGQDAGPLLEKRAGEALRCVHACEPGGCGRQEQCTECVLRGSVGQALAKGSVHRARAFVQLRGEGSEVDACLLVSASPIRLGGETRVLLTLENVSDVQLKDEFIRTEQALSESEARYRLLFQNMLDGFAYCRVLLDAGGRPQDFVCLDVNGAFEKLTGLRDVVGKSMSEVLPGIREAHPELLEICGRVVRTGQPERFELDFQPLASRFSVSVHRPHPGHLAAVFDNITERKRAEERLGVLTRLYAVLSRVNEAIVRIRDERSLLGEVCRIVSEEGGFPLVWVGLVREREVAPAAAYGRAAEYLREIRVETEGALGCGPTGTCIRADRPVINDDFASNPATGPWREPALRHGLRASSAFPLRRQGGVVGALTLYAEAPGAFTPEHIRLLEALCADISYALDAMDQERLRTGAEQALRESERSLRQADQRKDEFLAVLSHELRNPLAPIHSSLQVLDRASPGSDQAARAKEVIDRQVTHLAELVDDLLDVTRISRGKVTLDRSRVDAREVVRHACEDLRAVLNERGVRLEVAAPEGAVWIDADATRISQVVGNLLQNAAKFTPRGGSTWVSVAAAGRHAEIRVRDDGIGIEPELVQRVFEPFTQAERGLARAQGGLGLGLALVKGLVEMHGGTVGARSEGPNLGSEFVVSLPLAPDRGPARPPARAAPAPSPRTILVIDDYPDSAQSLAELLALGGHSLHLATDGASGIATARRVKPDVVLCDIGLPDLDGYQVARVLRADESLRSAFLVALSGYAQAEDERRALDAGFDAHVGKPASREDLDALLAEAATRRG